MLSDRKIREAMKDGRLIIEGFDPKNLGPNGYDVTLDPRHWRFQEYLYHSAMPYIMDLSNPGSVDLEEYFELVDPRDENKHYMEIHPGRFYLCNTHEIVGTPHTGSPRDLVAFFRTRSTLARLGKTYDLTGMGDVGFVSKWTLEVFNASPILYYMPLYARIGQLVFFEVGEVDNPYKGRYSTEDFSWHPRMMLPRINSIPMHDTPPPPPAPHPNTNPNVGWKS